MIINDKKTNCFQAFRIFYLLCAAVYSKLFTSFEPTKRTKTPGSMVGNKVISYGLNDVKRIQLWFCSAFHLF